MESKYYTPTIEEFHIGFEFEYKSKNDDWNKIDYDNWMHPREDKYLKHCTESELLRSFNFIDQCIKRNELKVKYLDKEDIESLGFDNYQPPYEYDHTWYYKGSRDPKIKVWFNGEIPTVRIYSSYPAIQFNGNIKNKSELKRLLQQLNIK